MTEHDDPHVRAAFARLRAHDQRSAPPFDRVLANARRALERRRRRRMVAGGLAMAAAVLLVVWLGRSTPEPWPVVRFDGTEPLAFLAQPPSASVLSSERPYDLAEESF